MNCLLSSTSIILNIRKDVLNEVKLFYRNLYSYRDVDQVNLEDILQSGNSPKLDANMRQPMKRKTTYDEVLFNLKNMSNDKSPRYDSFTLQFLKLFGKDIGYFWLDL